MSDNKVNLNNTPQVSIGIDGNPHGCMIEWVTSKILMPREQLYRVLEIDEAKWVEWVVGEAYPTIEQCKALASFAGVTIASLYLASPEIAEQCYVMNEPPSINDEMAIISRRFPTDGILAIGVNMMFTAMNAVTHHCVNLSDQLKQLEARIRQPNSSIIAPNSNEMPNVIKLPKPF